MEVEPLVEILLSTYNGAKYIEEQITSVIAQTHKNIRLLIRDDGSTDNTITIIKEMQNKYEEKISFIEDNLHFGPYQSFGRLIELSSAEYIMLCDQDDVWLPQKVEKTLDRLRDIEQKDPNTPILIFTDLVVVDSDLQNIYNSMWSSQKLNPEYSKNYKRAVAISVATGCTMMFNKSSKNYITPIPDHIYHDHWILMNISYFGIVDYIEEPLILYRQHNSNVVGKEHVNIPYMLKHLKNINNYLKVLKVLKFRVNVFEYFYLKISINLKRLINVNLYNTSIADK